MNSGRHARVKEIFLRACLLEGAERARFLEESCAGDAALRAAVVELLTNDADPHALLVGPSGADSGGAARWLARDLAGLAADEPSTERLPETIGAYRIVRLLGRGGMGSVYEAEQENPKRRVAVKVLSIGPGSPDRLLRFRQEAEILGRLHHAGIAHVYEAGTAEIQGSLQPYFAMELVEGATLLEHAQREELELTRRLELLVQVCDAVQHAHDNGILHRDLKPSNIVVDPAGRAKVLDFGVARMLERADGANPSATVSGIVVGTLATMSPEQVSGSSSELDARSDVYSLGVIAYEMLCERAPLDVSGLSLPEAARRICEQDPPPAGTFVRALRGDLETILAKALAKDRAQRYGSARELAEDVQRFLRHEPIVARPASTFYQLRMFARRNRALVAACVVAGAALAIGAGVAVWFAWRESGLRAVAEREAYRANVVAANLALHDGNPLQTRNLLNASSATDPAWEWRRVHRGLQQWIATFDLGQGVSQASFLDGGRAIVAVGRKGATRVWDAESGALEVDLADDPRRSAPLALTADGAACVSLGAGQLVVWDTRTGAECWRCAAPSGTRADPRNVACLSPEGRWLGAHGRLFAIGAPEIASRAIPAGLMSFDGTGAHLAVRGSASITVEETMTGLRLQSFPCAANSRALALDPTGRRLAVNDNQRVVLYELADGSQRVLAEPQPDVPTAFAFRPDGARLAAMQDDGSIWIRDVDHDVVVRRLWVGGSSWKTSLAWSRDGTRLLSAGWTDQIVRLWDAREDPEVLRGHERFVYPVLYTPDGRCIVSGSWDHTVRVWSATTNEPLATLKEHTGRVQVLAVSPDSTRFASGSDDGQLITWDARTGTPSNRARVKGTWMAVAWSPDGTRLAAATSADGGAVRILSADSLETLATLTGHSRTVMALTFCAADGSLASGGEDGDVIVRDMPEGRERARIDGKSPVRALAFSRDGRQLAVAGDATRLSLYDARTLTLRKSLVGHAREVFGAAFSPDGTRCFSGGRDGRLRVWDTAGGDLVGEFEGHADYIWSVDVHPDGRRVATGSGDGTVRQWEAESAPISHRRIVEGTRLAREAEPKVAAWLAEAGDAAAVAARIDADPTLSEGLRRAALDELLRRSSARR